MTNTLDELQGLQLELDKAFELGQALCDKAESVASSLTAYCETDSRQALQRAVRQLNNLDDVTSHTKSVTCDAVFAIAALRDTLLKPASFTDSTLMSELRRLIVTDIKMLDTATAEIIAQVDELLKLLKYCTVETSTTLALTGLYVDANELFKCIYDAGSKILAESNNYPRGGG